MRKADLQRQIRAHRSEKAKLEGENKQVDSQFQTVEEEIILCRRQEEDIRNALQRVQQDDSQGSENIVAGHINQQRR